MSNSITLTEAHTGFELFAEKSIVAMRVNGELRDLAHQALIGDVVEGVDIPSQTGSTTTSTSPQRSLPKTWFRSKRK
jgi:threonyl-tRNA synthetase